VSHDNPKARTVNSDVSCEEMCEEVRRLYAKHRHVTFSWTTGRQRTLTQNAALHLWLTWLAERLNAAGLDMRRVLRHDVDIPWTMEAAKTYLWKPIQLAMTSKEATADAERLDYSKVQETLARHLAAKLGVECPPWPKKQDKEAA
jgi:hypothetical protein